MLTLLNYIVLISMGVYGLFIIGDLIISHAVKRCIIEVIILLGVCILLNVTTGFPIPKQIFGVPPMLAIGIMYICTLLGTMAHYFFYKTRFSWKPFLKPLLISPMIFFPLIGTVQGITEFEPIQLLSFGILAFQNGFFWKELFELQREKIREHANQKK
jgi:hypothetical protein